jgi:uncharacterized protein
LVSPPTGTVYLFNCAAKCSWYHADASLAPQLLRELVVKLTRKQVPEADVEDLVSLIAAAALHIPGAYESTRLDDIDPDDNIFLAAAYEAKADYIVSLDKQHLLPLKHYHGTQILTPALFIRSLKAAAS